MRSGPIKELLRTRESLFHQMPKVLYKTHLATKVQRLFSKVGLLYNPISQGIQVLTLILNLIDTSLSLFHSFTVTFFLIIEKMRPFVWNADHVISLICMRTKLMKWSAFRPQLTQKVSFSQLLKKSGSEAEKKGERSVNQIENKGEGMHLLGNGII